MIGAENIQTVGYFEIGPCEVSRSYVVVSLVVRVEESRLLASGRDFLRFLLVNHATGVFKVYAEY